MKPRGTKGARTTWSASSASARASTCWPSLGVGPQASPVAEHVLAITDYACQRLLELGAELLAPRTGEHRSGIVTFKLAGHDPNEIRRRLEAAGIIVRCRAGGVRISPHGYATTGEVDHLIDELRQIARAAS